MKIAVCLSGQSRTWKIAYKNILHFFDYSRINKDIQVDYFIHTWDNNSWRKKEDPQWKTWDAPAEGLDQIQTIFKPVHLEIETFSKIKFPMAWDGLFYSFMKSIHNKRRYEMQNNFKYDAVVKSRLDVIFQPEKIFDFNITPLTAYSTHPVSKMLREFNVNNFSDVMFYADSNTMDMISNVYRYSKLRHSKSSVEHNTSSKIIDYFSHYGPGGTLYEYMNQHGIYPTCGEIYQYAVVRNECEGLDSIEDAEKIFKIGQEWYNGVA
jgi:hypothetical protein